MKSMCSQAANCAEKRMKTTGKSLQEGRRLFFQLSSRRGEEGGDLLVQDALHQQALYVTHIDVQLLEHKKTKHSSVQLPNYKHITVALIAVEYQVKSVFIRYLSLTNLTHCCCGKKPAGGNRWQTLHRHKPTVSSVLCRFSFVSLRYWSQQEVIWKNNY